MLREGRLGLSASAFEKPKYLLSDSNSGVAWCVKTRGTDQPSNRFKLDDELCELQGQQDERVSGSPLSHTSEDQLRIDSELAWKFWGGHTHQPPRKQRQQLQRWREPHEYYS